MALAGLRNATVTPDDHGPLVAIATWFLMVAMILSVLIRVAVRFIITRHSGREDALTVVAMVIFLLASSTTFELDRDDG